MEQSVSSLTVSDKRLEILQAKHVTSHHKFESTYSIFAVYLNIMTIITNSHIQQTMVWEMTISASEVTT